jgi:hypothetical protein
MPHNDENVAFHATLSGVEGMNPFNGNLQMTG